MMKKNEALKTNLDIILIMGATKNTARIMHGCLLKQINDLL